MSQKAIEQELRTYLNQEPNLRHEDKLKYLMAIFEKHFVLSKLEHNVKRGDFMEMLSYAKSQWVHTVMPVRMTSKELDDKETNYMLVMDALIAYLNGKQLLNKNIKFDITR